MLPSELGAKMLIRTYVKSDDGNTYLIDTIEHDGGLWLVPKWLDTPYPKMRRPARMIRMDSLAHTNHGDILYNGSRILQLNDPIPKAVLDGASPSQSDPLLDVVEAPELMIRR
jgi:hypothetical protein